jgi:hypothetical protein
MVTVGNPRQGTLEAVKPQPESIKEPKNPRSPRKRPSTFIKEGQRRLEELNYAILHGETYNERLNASREASELIRHQDRMKKIVAEIQRRNALSEEQERQREAARREKLQKMEQEYGTYSTGFYGQGYAYDMQVNAEIEEEVAAFRARLNHDIDALEKAEMENRAEATATRDDVTDNPFDWASLAGEVGKQSKVRGRNPRMFNLPTGAGTILILLLIIILMHMLVVPVGATGYTRWQLAGKALAGKVEVDGP